MGTPGLSIPREKIHFWNYPDYKSASVKYSTAKASMAPLRHSGPVG
jgi:hypothetical protein